jgi:ABC-type transporter Mla subunit MlaD
MPPSRARRESPVPSSSGDSDGCLFVLILMLWWFGFLTFHSRERGRAIGQLNEATSQLAAARSELAELSTVIADVRTQSAELLDQRETLAGQVGQLERARDEIAASIGAAESIVGPVRESRTRNLLRSIRSSLPGELAGAAVIALLALATRWLRKRGRPRHADSSTAP